MWPRHLMDLLSDEEGVDWDENVENRLVINELGSRAAYHQIYDFISDLPDGPLARRLDRPSPAAAHSAGSKTS